MSNHHTHSIEEYQFSHGFHRTMSSGKYIALHPHYLGRPLTHEEMDFNLLYAEQTLAGFRIFGSNADLSLSDDDLGKSLLFHKIASSDADFARYTAAGYIEGQYIWIPDCCGTQVDCSTFQVVSISAIDSGGQDDCISFTVDNIVATDSEGGENVVTPTPTATQNITPTPTTATAPPPVTPTPTPTEVPSAPASIGNLWISNNTRDEHYEYSIPANNASSFIQTNQINIDAYDSHVASSNNVIGFASSINNAIMIYRRSGTQWNYEASVPCFVNDDSTLSISMNKNHFDFSDDGNTLVCISNVGAGDDITEYGGGSQTEGRIYKYQPTSGAWILSGVIPRLSNNTGMRYASISADGNTVTFSEFAAQNDPGLSVDFPRRRTGIWNWSGTQWVPKMNPAGYEQGYRTYLNSDGSKMLTTTFDPSNHLSDTPTGVKIMHWDSSAGVIGAWVDEFIIPNTSTTLVPRMFSPNGNEFVIGDGNTEYVYAWDGATWNLKGTITTGATGGQYSYESNDGANILTVQEWTTYLQDGTISVWEYDGNNYVQLTPELTHGGFSHSSALAAVSVPTITPTPTVAEVVTPTPTSTPAATPTATPAQAVNSITLAYNYSLGMGSLSFSGKTTSELGDATCNALAANYQTQTYYGTLGLGTQFTNENNGDSNQSWVTNQYYGTNQGPLWVNGSTEYIIETDFNGVVVRYEPFNVECLTTPTPTAAPVVTPTPTPTTESTSAAQFNWVVSTDVNSTNRVNYVEENLENDLYGVWASNEELQLKHYEYPGISFNYFPVSAGESYYIKLESDNPSGRFTISSVTGRNATNSVYLFNNDPAIIYTIDSAWNKSTDSTRPDVAFLNSENQAVDNACAYDSEGLVKIYNKLDTNNGTNSTLCDANGYLSMTGASTISENYIKIDVPDDALPGEEFTIGWGGLQYWPNWAQGQNGITDTEWVTAQQITPGQETGSIQFRVIENRTQPIVTPTPLPADNKLPISLVRSIGTLGNVADSTYSDTQAFLIEKNYAPTGYTGVNERTSGNPYNPQSGDILYDDVSWSDELNPLPNSTFAFRKAVPLGTDEWFWITTDNNGIMTVTQL